METNDFTVLYAEYKKLLERYIHNKISNFADAEDVIQDVLTAAYKNCPHSESFHSSAGV